MRLLALFAVLFAAYAATLALPGRGRDDRSAREARYLVVATSLHEDGDLAVADEYRDRVYREFHRGVLRPPSKPHAGRLLEGVGVGLPPARRAAARPRRGHGGRAAVRGGDGARDDARRGARPADRARPVGDRRGARGRAVAPGARRSRRDRARAAGRGAAGRARRSARCASATPTPTRPCGWRSWPRSSSPLLPWLSAELALAGARRPRGDRALDDGHAGAGCRRSSPRRSMVFSAIVYVSVNERLFGGIVPRVVLTRARRPARRASLDHVARVTRLVTLWADPGERPARLGARARARVPRAVAAVAVAARAPRARGARPARRGGRGDAVRARVRRAAARRRVLRARRARSLVPRAASRGRTAVRLRAVRVGPAPGAASRARPRRADRCDRGVAGRRGGDGLDRSRARRTSRSGSGSSPSRPPWGRSLPSRPRTATDAGGSRILMGWRRVSRAPASSGARESWPSSRPRCRRPPTGARRSRSWPASRAWARAGCWPSSSAARASRARPSSAATPSSSARASFPTRRSSARCARSPASDDAVLGELSAANRAELATLLPELARRDDTPRRRGHRRRARLGPAPALRGAPRRSSSASAARRPVVLALEDVHWADRSTRAFLAFLARSLCDEPRPRRPRPTAPTSCTAAIRCARCWPSSSARRAHGGSSWPASTARSSPSSSRTSSARRRRRTSSTACSSAARATRSSPRSSWPPASTGAAACPRPCATRSWSASSACPTPPRRPCGCSPPGAGSTTSSSRTPAGMEPRALREALRVAVESHIAVVDDEGWHTFRHALLREVIVDDLLPGERSALHLALAHAFERRFAEGPRGAWVAARIAEHYRAAGDQPAELAARRAGGGARRRRPRARRGRRAARARARAVGPRARRGGARRRRARRPPAAVRPRPLPRERRRTRRDAHGAGAGGDRRGRPSRGAPSEVLGDLATMRWTLGRGEAARDTLAHALELAPGGRAEPRAGEAARRPGALLACSRAATARRGETARGRARGDRRRRRRRPVRPRPQPARHRAHVRRRARAGSHDAARRARARAPAGPPGRDGRDVREPRRRPASRGPQPRGAAGRPRRACGAARPDGRAPRRGCGHRPGRSPSTSATGRRRSAACCARCPPPASTASTRSCARPSSSSAAAATTARARLLLDGTVELVATTLEPQFIGGVAALQAELERRAGNLARRPRDRRGGARPAGVLHGGRALPRAGRRGRRRRRGRHAPSGRATSATTRPATTRWSASSRSCCASRPPRRGPPARGRAPGATAEAEATRGRGEPDPAAWAAAAEAWARRVASRTPRRRRAGARPRRTSRPATARRPRSPRAPPSATARALGRHGSPSEAEGLVARARLRVDRSEDEAQPRDGAVRGASRSG